MGDLSPIMLIRYHSSDDVAGNNLTFTATNVSKGGQLALGENVDHRAGRAKELSNLIPLW